MKQNATTAAQLRAWKDRAKTLRRQRDEARRLLDQSEEAQSETEVSNTLLAAKLAELEVSHTGQATIIRTLSNDLRHARSEQRNLAIDLDQLRRAKDASEALAQAAAADQAGTIRDLRVDLRRATHVNVEMPGGIYAVQDHFDALNAQERTPNFGGILPTDLLGDGPQRTHDLRDIDPQPSVHEASSSERLNWFARKAQRTELLDLLEAAWGIIANAGPIEVGPPTATPGWSEAALRFREGYHDLLGRLYPSEPTDSELLDSRAAQALAEYQERTGLTDEQVAALTARGLLDAIDAPLADSTPEELAALAALAEELAPLRDYEPMSTPAGIVTQDTETGEVVSGTSAPYEAATVPMVDPELEFQVVAANPMDAIYIPEEEGAELREGESWEDMNERHAAYAQTSAIGTPSIGTDRMELVTERVATFAKDQDTYLRSLAALPTP